MHDRRGALGDRIPVRASSRALLVIAKRPESGQTKTRLSPPLSGCEASQLYECFLRDTLAIAREVPGVHRFITYSPMEEEGYFRCLAPDFDLVPQVGAGLGERLDNALTHCLTSGFGGAVIMDSDSPTLPSGYVSMAFHLLERADVVLGPCEDGGYYLIGLRSPQPRLLREVQMSTRAVLADTMGLARDLGLSLALLPVWYDVDTPADFLRLRTALLSGTDGPGHFTRQLLAGARTRICSG